MASFYVCGCGLAAARSLPPPSKAVARHRYPNASILHNTPKRIPTPQLSPNSLPFGIKMARRVLAAHASNLNPSGEEKSGGTSRDSDAGAQGPPLLTILAGFGVFFIVFWIIKSIVIWFIGLIVKLAASK